MNSNQQKRARKTPILLILVVVTSILTALTGVSLKYTVCRSAGILQNTFAMAIPFILLEDASLRDALSAPKKPENVILPTEAPTEPSSSAEESESALPAKVSFTPVDEAYWDGVLFIGDSRTDGLRMYSPMEKADYFSASSLNSYDILSDDTILSMPGNYENLTLEQLLSERQYHAIYVMLGINEIGHSIDGIQAKYQLLLDKLQELQPQAYIVVQANLHVTKALGESNPELELIHFQELDRMLASLADNEQIFYLDVNPLFCDEEGYLKPELTKDGCHPYAIHYQEWKDFLMQNGIR